MGSSVATKWQNGPSASLLETDNMPLNCKCSCALTQALKLCPKAVAAEVHGAGFGVV